jgi:predicted nucleic acid-binding protein
MRPAECLLVSDWMWAERVTTCRADLERRGAMIGANDLFVAAQATAASHLVTWDGGTPARGGDRDR